MNITNLFKIALKAIAANKMRSFLTALGIIIGIASVITMLAIGQGTKNSIRANIAQMGSNMIMISPGADRRGGVQQDASSMETLKLTDYQALKDECKYIKAISPVVSSTGQFIYGNENTPSTITGVNQDYLEIRQLKVADGEMFTDTDIKTSAKVCLLGQTVVDNLFPDGSDPIGEGNTLQLHTFQGDRSDAEKGLQLYGHGPGRLCSGTLYVGYETHFGTNLPGTDTGFGHHRGRYRPGNRRDDVDTQAHA